jgi:hypothetical protein
VRRWAVLAIGVIAVAMLAACSGSPQPAPTGSPSTPVGTLKTYASPPYRFSVQYDPGSLTAADMSFSTEMLTLAFSPSGRQGEMLLLASKSPRPVSPSALRHWLAATVGSYAPDSRLGRVGHATVGGLPALVSEGVVGGTLQTRTYVFGSGRYAYLFSLQGSLRDWQDLLPRYEEVVKSFTVLR